MSLSFSSTICLEKRLSFEIPPKGSMEADGVSCSWLLPCETWVGTGK